MRIRDADAGDAAAIADLQVTSWRDAFRGLLPADYLDALDPEERATEWERTIRALDDRGCVLVADEDGALQGFVHSGPSADSDDGQVFAMHVAPPLRGRGIGFDLHDLALRRLKNSGFAEAELWLLRDNEAARRFYERQGWLADVRERRGMPPTDAIEVRYVRAL